MEMAQGRRIVVSVPCVTDTKEYPHVPAGGSGISAGCISDEGNTGTRPATKIPETPANTTGLIALNGSVVPVLDMRLKFGPTESENTVGLRKGDRGRV